MLSTTSSTIPTSGPFVSKQLIQHLVTSNPSPAYVQRVARVFADNGLGVRGDMKSIIRAILLDPEAADDPALSVSKGHLRHPVLLVTSLLRAFNVGSAAGGGYSDGYLNPQNQNMGMNLFAPPSVFSYFSPSTGVSGSNLRGPEFGLLNTSTAIRTSELCQHDGLWKGQCFRQCALWDRVGFFCASGSFERPRSRWYSR